MPSFRGFDMNEGTDKNSEFNALVVLGATAVGKTAYAVKAALRHNGEIISADSRQVYRGLDIGTGKDLNEYGSVPYHLIDICPPEKEYNLFDFQKDAYTAFTAIRSKGRLPVFAGGTGLYLDSVIRKYELVPVPENAALREELSRKPMEELQTLLLALKPDIHNKTDLEQRDRLIRAVEIAEYKRLHPEAAEAAVANRPDIRPYIKGLRFPRTVLKERIKKRLLERIDAGMIEETKRLHDEGLSWERLESFGLEYKFTALYLQNKIGTKERYIEELYRAICAFAKRQETWFRRMEKNGVRIDFIECERGLPDSEFRLPFP